WGDAATCACEDAAANPARYPDSQASCSGLDLATTVLRALISAAENGAELGMRAREDMSIRFRRSYPEKTSCSLAGVSRRNQGTKGGVRAARRSGDAQKLANRRRFFYS